MEPPYGSKTLKYHTNIKKVVRFEVSTAVTMMIIISQKMTFIIKKVINSQDQESQIA
jgi:hypothetical protein